MDIDMTSIQFYDSCMIILYSNVSLEEVFKTPYTEIKLKYAYTCCSWLNARNL